MDALTTKNGSWNVQPSCDTSGWTGWIPLETSQFQISSWANLPLGGFWRAIAELRLAFQICVFQGHRSKMHISGVLVTLPVDPLRLHNIWSHTPHCQVTSFLLQMTWTPLTPVPTNRSPRIRPIVSRSSYRSASFCHSRWHSNAVLLPTTWDVKPSACPKTHCRRNGRAVQGNFEVQRLILGNCARALKSLGSAFMVFRVMFGLGSYIHSWFLATSYPTPPHICLPGTWRQGPNIFK